MDSSHGRPEMARNETHNKAAILPITPNRVDKDDESDWEYEYSSTETETFYLTLDMSIPDFCSRVLPESVTGGRGGYRAWFSDKTRLTELQPTNRALLEEEDENGDNAELPEPEDRDSDQDGDRQGSPRKDAAGDEPPGMNGDDASSSELQILELHSDNPIIAHRGHVMSGQWAANIGTELIFAERDAKDPMPALRQLTDRVDLLAASSARIVVSEKELARKETAEISRKEQHYDKLRKEQQVFIPITEGSNAKRKVQGRFLETLQAIKRAKGEKDCVTSHAVDFAKRPPKTPFTGRSRRGRHRRLPGDLSNAGVDSTWSHIRGMPHEDDNGDGDRSPVHLRERTNLSKVTPVRWADMEGESLEAVTIVKGRQDESEDGDYSDEPDEEEIGSSSSQGEDDDEPEAEFTSEDESDADGEGHGMELQDQDEEEEEEEGEEEEVEEGDDGEGDDVESLSTDEEEAE